MGSLRYLIRKLRTARQTLARAWLVLPFLAATAILAPAAAAPLQGVVPHQRDELRLPEDYVFPRKGTVVQAALTALPNRPKDSGGFTPKPAERASIFVVLPQPSPAPDVRLESSAAIDAHFWTWTSRAPPAADA